MEIYLRLVVKNRVVVQIVESGSYPFTAKCN